MAIGNHGDGLDDHAWDHLRVLVAAAGESDRLAFHNEIESWSADVPLTEQHKIGLYLLAGTEYITQRILRRKPSEADLKELAARCVPSVSRVLTLHPMVVEDALRATFDLKAIKRELSPGELGLILAAIIGCLLTEPEGDLSEIRTYVAEWWKVNAQAIRQAGVKDS